MTLVTIFILVIVKSITNKIIFTLINILYFLSAFLTYLLNPGTVYKSDKNQNKAYCKICDFNYPYHKRLKHCTFCNICVIGIDHHCGVFGKCIARNNIICFYAFIVLTFISIFASMGILLYSLVQLGA